LAQLGMTPAHLLENRYRPQTGRRLQQRHDLAVPDGQQRIGTPPLSGELLVRRQAWILLEAVSARAAKAGSNGGLSEKLIA
jgi:hypothetical protein